MIKSSFIIEDFFVKHVSLFDEAEVYRVLRNTTINITLLV